jgi:hypothetical protein
MVKIVCEGRSDKNYLSKFLSFLEIKHSDDNFIVMGNKSAVLDIEHVNYKTLLTLVKANKVEKTLFVVDADFEKDNQQYGGYYNTHNALKRLSTGLELQSSCYIACDPLTQEGYFESLLLSTVEDKVKVCGNSYLECIDSKKRDDHKNILEQLFKLTKPEKPYDFSHKNFNDLKEKLNELFTT